MNRRFIAPITAAVIGLVNAGSIEDIDHVILFMQENRAFDHYFGTMPGVRGFNDPNIHYNDDRPVWDQLKSDNQYMNPWYLNYQGQKQLSQCVGVGPGPNWEPNRKSYNYGGNDMWPIYESPVSIGFFKKDDIPTQYSVADSWVVGDMYQESVFSNTDPNRVWWMSGSINVPGSPQIKDQGGFPYIQTNGNSGGDDSGCDSHGINCLPLKWTTAPEHYEAAGIDWQVFQDGDTAAENFGDNALIEFEIFRNATSGPLVDRGEQGLTLDQFYQRLKNGTLPEISYIIARPDLSEHVGFGTPNDGGSLQDQVVRSVLASPVYNKTALIISYDEGGGWFDHVIPYTSPSGTAGEWLQDPIAGTGYTFAGPGIRVPMYIVSPWTRKGGVYTEHADHTSQLLFIEKWQEAKGRNVTSNEIVHWRRDNMADLVNAFDFDNPDYSIPNLPTAPKYQGYDRVCHDKTGPLPPQSGNGITVDMGSVVEMGFKPVRGKLTEGRRLVLEMNGAALTHPDNGGSHLTTSGARQQHDDKEQQWVINAIKIGGNDFTMKSAGDGRYICKDQKSAAVFTICKDQKSAVVFTLGFQAGSGHTFQVRSSGQYMVAGQGGQVSFSGGRQSWRVYSVNY